MTEQITDSQVLTSLLAEENLDGFTVKPWTIKQLLQVMPILNALVQELKDKGVSLDNLEDLLERQRLMAVNEMIQAILPQLPEFLAISVRIEREQAEEIDLGLALQLGVKVLALNLEHLKNSFGLIMGQVGPMIRPAAATP